MEKFKVILRSTELEASPHESQCQKKQNKQQQKAGMTLPTVLSGHSATCLEAELGDGSA